MTTTQKVATMLQGIDDNIHDIAIAIATIKMARSVLEDPNRFERDFIVEIKEIAHIAGKLILGWEMCQKIETMKKSEKMTEEETKRHERNVYSLFQHSRSWHKKATNLIKRFNSFPTP